MARMARRGAAVHSPSGSAYMWRISGGKTHAHGNIGG